jgi:hypothetical protein
MKHRYHLWLIGALVIGSSSIAQARIWKGSNGLYDTLADCLGKNGAPCYYMGRIVEAGTGEALSRTSAAADARIARTDRREAVLYYTRATAPISSTQGKLTPACLGKGGGFTNPTCGRTEVLVYVEEF